MNVQDHTSIRGVLSAATVLVFASLEVMVCGQHGRVVGDRVSQARSLHGHRKRRDSTGMFRPQAERPESQTLTCSQSRFTLRYMNDADTNAFGPVFRVSSLIAVVSVATIAIVRGNPPHTTVAMKSSNQPEV